MMAELDLLNGFAGKVISDCIDITIYAIKKADKNRKAKNQNMETRIYQVTIDALNVFPYNNYKKKEKVYDAAESILKELKRGNCNYKESVRAGLNMLSSEITEDVCEDFLNLLCYEICKAENRDLAIGCIINQGEQVVYQQKQTNRYIQEGFRESHENEKKILRDVSEIKKDINNWRAGKNGSGIHVENRADEYARKWNENVFLNNFNEEDENVGMEIKLWEIYKEECLPHYIWKKNAQPSKKTLRDKLKEYIIDKQSRKMLLILGQPGIGKSTLITWIMANLVEKKDDILVYQFANDLGGINWQGENVLNDIFNIISLEYDELENKTLILDGFDEVYVGGDRERILNKLEQELKRRNVLRNFSLIITCRENYIYNLQNIACDYIVLQAWNEIQIEIFCRAYWEKCGNNILADKIQRIMENKAIFGIPLILYMILALDVDIEKGSSKMDIYDQVFSLKRGGIYDRCYDSEHRINFPEIKEHIHRISQKIAFWMFENNADKAFISREKFEEICESEMSKSGGKGEEIQSDTLIGNFYKLRHCEGQGTDELQFVHRSIYEYFVAAYFFESVHKLASKEEAAGKLGELLKDGHLSEQILEFIKYKFDKIKNWNLSEITKEIFQMMLQNGMTYYIETKYNNIIEREMNIFANMLEIVNLWNSKVGEVDEKITIYLRCNRESNLNLKGIKLSAENFLQKKFDLRGAYLNKANLLGADLSRLDLRRVHLNGANLRETNLSEVDLSRSDLIGVHLYGANLSEADLSKADLRYADLRNVDLRGANLRGANLSRANLVGAELSEANLEESYLNMTLFNEEQVKMLDSRKNDLNLSDVLLSEIDEVIDYQEYCNRSKIFE